MHELIGYGVILLAVFAGILFNNSRFDRIEGRLDRMQSDLSQFYRDLGRHDAQLDALAKK